MVENHASTEPSPYRQSRQVRDRTRVQLTTEDGSTAHGMNLAEPYGHPRVSSPIQSASNDEAMRPIQTLNDDGRCGNRHSVRSIPSNEDSTFRNGNAVSHSTSSRELVALDAVDKESVRAILKELIRTQEENLRLNQRLPEAFGDE